MAASWTTSVASPDDCSAERKDDGASQRGGFYTSVARLNISLKKIRHTIIMRTAKFFVLGFSSVAVATIAMWGVVGARARQTALTPPPPIPLATGQFLTPQGTQTDAGSYPCNALLSPDGKYLAITSLGAKSQISILDVADGRLASKIEFDGAQADKRSRREGLFYGLAFGSVAADGTTTLYAAQGSDDRIATLTLAADGTLTRSDKAFFVQTDRFKRDKGKKKDDPLHLAGIALSSDARRLYAACNSANPLEKMGSVLKVLDTTTGNVTGTVALPGYPFAVTAVTTGENKDKKIYVSSEQGDSVSVVDAADLRVTATIRTGANATTLLLNKAQDRLFVANSGGDTISVIDTGRDRVVETIVLRPSDMRGLPAVTPLGMTLSPDEKTLYIALGDLNAVAVVDVAKKSVSGYIPAGWYPTAVALSPENQRLFVANAKGVAERNPNADPKASGRVADAFYIQNVIKGTVSTIPIPDAATLDKLTAQTIKNNQIQPDMTQAARQALRNPGIEHIIYIIKENRTYDQVLGDVKQGDGDPTQVLFGRDVTPNQHALAERFVLLDNFYCSGEVSGDGWNWSTQGMANEYNARNVVYGYTGKSQPYDYEGTNNGVAVDRQGVKDVSRTPGGYFWENCARNHVSFYNFGIFLDDLEAPRQTAEEGSKGEKNAPTQKILIGKSSSDFRGFDGDFADSEAWVKHHLSPAPKQMAIFGGRKDPSRFTTFRWEYEEFARRGKMPRFLMVRFGNDHTQGTTAGAYSPRAMVADNDYAVGQLVELVSHSAYWKKTAIFIIEDDAQNGNDHVDAHRSIAFVVSPFVTRASKDSRFYNTDSVLHTMENLLGLPPMNRYDAAAPALTVFAATPENDAPYEAILPAKAIIAEINQKTAYRAADSARLIPRLAADATPDEELNDILWHSIKGKNTPMPPTRHSLKIGPPSPKSDADKD